MRKGSPRTSKGLTALGEKPRDIGRRWLARKSDTNEGVGGIYIQRVKGST